MTQNADSGLGGVPIAGRAGEDRPIAEPVGQTAKPLAHNADSERVIREAEITIRWLLSKHPEAKAQALSWLAAYAHNDSLGAGA